MTGILEQVQKLYALEGFVFTPISGHEGGRNRIVTVSRNGENKFVLRISDLDDRNEEDYLAETEFVRFLAEDLASSHTVGARLPPPFALDCFFRRNSGVELSAKKSSIPCNLQSRWHDKCASDFFILLSNSHFAQSLPYTVY